ncbi:substrate-binding domain-containing protein [Oricola cellulosilytica]|uniref:Sugar ABC transporter substrate-binding protein n=1 Tax=Oricola cellulosilytica TaxID=1429082 RepID=A0A4R0PDN3_9HYPH|nr:substrate-binding domain-containing protein [Oricola cellulosilytica]TCD13346.1 sugar ABC transporter substrate-binding protein [Oricola cellulosilytica]
MSITGLGPHGERAAAPSRVALTEDDIKSARGARFSVAIVFHTTDSDWSRQSLAGIAATLGHCGAVVTEVVDCGFDAGRQIEALTRLKDEDVDAIVSIPVANAAVVESHRQVARAGRRLILHDNVPTGLLPGSDYTSLVSADNFGLGLIGAELLSPHVQADADVGLLTYGVDFYATNERDIAFARWMRANRPDLVVRTQRFAALDRVGEALEELIDDRARLAGLFVVWDTPAMDAVATLERRGLDLPVTTVDLGLGGAMNLAAGKSIVGIAAQQPYMQGVAVAQTAILSLLNRPVPGWVALPGLAVTRSNVAENYQQVWSSAAPAALLAAQRE